MAGAQKCRHRVLSIVTRLTWEEDDQVILGRQGQLLCAGCGAGDVGGKGEFVLEEVVCVGQRACRRESCHHSEQRPEARPLSRALPGECDVRRPVSTSA